MKDTTFSTSFTGVMIYTQRKFLTYFSIFTILLGSTLGFNTAYAGDGDAVGVANSTTTVNADTSDIDQSDLTLQTDESSSTTFTLTGDINVDTITFEDSDSVASAIAVSSDITVDETIIMPETPKNEEFKAAENIEIFSSHSADAEVFGSGGFEGDSLIVKRS